MPSRCASFPRKIRHLAVARPQVSAPVRKTPCHQLCHHAPQRTCETVAQVHRPFKHACQLATHGPATSGSDGAQTCISLREHSAPRSRSASGAGPALGSPADSRVSRPAASLREHVGRPKARWASPGLRRRSEPPRGFRQCSLAHARDTLVRLSWGRSPPGSTPGGAARGAPRVRH
jgi:hypothetical protein